MTPKSLPPPCLHPCSWRGGPLTGQILTTNLNRFSGPSNYTAFPWSIIFLFFWLIVSYFLLSPVFQIMAWYIFTEKIEVVRELPYMYPALGICVSCVISPYYSATLCFRLSPSLVLGIGWPISTLSNALLTPVFPSLFCSSVLLLFSLFYPCTKCCRKNMQILIPLPLPFRVVYILFPVLPYSKPTLTPITPPNLSFLPR